MADSKVSDLTAASSIADADSLYLVQGGASKKAAGSLVYRPSGTDVAVADGGTGASDARTAMANLKGVYILGASAVAVSVGATTDETAVATITVPANAMGVNGAIRVTTVWVFTNSANSKTPRVRFSTISGTDFQNGPTFTTQAGARLQCGFHNRNATNSQVGSAATSGFGGYTASNPTAAVDTTASSTIVITGQKANSGETLTLESYLVELIRP